MIAFRFGSNTNSMRISLLPEDPGLSSFIEGMRLDPFILPTIGRLRSGPCSSNNDTAASICTRDEVEAEKRRMLEEIRLYELKEARKAEHVTQKRLAQALGVSQKRISVIESGDVDHIKVDTLKRYLEGIGGTLHVTASLPGGKELRLV